MNKMKTPKIKYCPGSLKEGFTTYSGATLRRMFGNHKVSHILPLASPDTEGPQQEILFENRKRISISGVQEKFSVVLDKNKLRLTMAGENGQYILKPIPRDVAMASQVPANEHLTMQIARQIYDIDTAENCMIFFEDGKPAYLTKRFDIKDDGIKHGLQEDMATVIGKTKENGGQDYKYDYDYLNLGLQIKKSINAGEIVMEKYFKVVVFNYLFSNGDSHLKNFSLLQSENGDYLLSPAYDLLCTRLHVKDNDLALSGGLSEKSFDHSSFSALGYYAYDDFITFGRDLGLKETRVKKIMDQMCAESDDVKSMIKRSYLNEECKKKYLELYKAKLKALNFSYSKIK